MASVLTVWPLSNYGFGSKACESPGRDRSESARLERLRARFATEGTRRSVAALLVVHAHRHPHLLLLQDLSVVSTPPQTSPPASAFRLPGGRLRPGEDEVSGLARKLRARLSPPQEPHHPLAAWSVPRERAGTLVRPAFGPELYPYLPAHVTVPKEEIFLRVVPLPERLSFAVPEGFRLVAVPLMELHAAGLGGGGAGAGAGAGGGKFGAVAAAAPALLSRLALSLAAASASAPKVGLPPPDDGRMWKRDPKASGGAGGKAGEGDDKALVVAGGGGGSSKASPPRSSSSPPRQEEEKKEEEEEQEEQKEEEQEKVEGEASQSAKTSVTIEKQND